MPDRPAPAGDSDPDRAPSDETGESGRSARARIADEFRGWLKSFFFALVLVLIFRAHVAEGYQIKGASMRPCLYNADRLFVEKVTHHFRPYEAGDIVVFPHPREGKKLIKRVIAVGGQEVEIRRGIPWVDGKPIEESYLTEEWRDLRSWAREKVPEGTLFVLGDNRKSSNDSRNIEQVGFIPEDEVVGRAFLRFWPLERVRVFP